MKDQPLEVDHLFPLNPNSTARDWPETIRLRTDRKSAQLAWEAWAHHNPTEAERYRKSVNPQHWSDQ
jgi:hypothetical protein